jgi:hypothetical protein
MELFERIIAFFRDRYNKMTGEAKHRFALVCTAVFVVLLTLSVVISLGKSGAENRSLQPQRPKINLAIPAEEFFLPDEPDFLPGVLLERERRTSWTEQDAGEYWQDPLRSGEEQWREKIETAVDEFLERIP